MSTEVYTPEVTADIVERYVAVKGEEYDARTAVVREIADELGVTEPSVRGKLTSEGVYVSKAPSKSEAEATVTKEALAGAIGTVMGTDVPSLAKASKADLEKVWNFLRTASDQFNADNGVVEPTSE